MNSYLLACQSSNKCETAGFQQNGRDWIAPGLRITMDAAGNITLQKAAFSSLSMFYGYANGLFVTGSLWQDVCKKLEKEGMSLRLNLNYVYDYLKFQCPFTNETFCRDIFYLRNGEHVSIKADGQRISHFQPFVAQSNLSAPDLTAHLQRQLIQLDCRNTFFHISSGLDSSILATLAAKLHPEETVNVATLRTRGMGVSDELNTVHHLAQDFGFNLNVFDFTDMDIFAVGRELIENVLGYPIAHPSHLVRFLLDKRISCHAKTIVAGRGPDECLAGYAWHRPEYVDPEKHLNRLTVTGDELLRRLFRRDVNLFFGQRGQQSYRFWHSGTILSLRQRLRYDLLSIFEAWNIIEVALAHALAVRIINPFLDTALMKALLRLPDQFRIKEGQQKWFLRETFKNQYPDYILKQPKRALTLDVRPYLMGMSSDHLMKMLYFESAFGQKYLTEEGCRYLITSTLESTKNFGWQIWSIYLCSVAYDQLSNNGKTP